MARPIKQGIDYFPLDCQFDPKTEMYLVETESNGLSVLITLWQLIYAHEGYYINVDEDLHLLVKKRVNVGINEVNDCINVAIKRNLFNKKLFDKYKILTSHAIQKRFFDIAKRKKMIQFDHRYIINGINVSNNMVDVCENATKEIKVKESKVKKEYIRKKNKNRDGYDYPERKN